MRWLTTCGLIVSLALTACGPGDNSAPASTDTSSSTDIKPATTEPATTEDDRPASGMPGMTVQSAGNEPRQAVRYHSEPGAEIQRRLTTTVRLD